MDHCGSFVCDWYIATPLQESHSIAMEADVLLEMKYVEPKEGDLKMKVFKNVRTPDNLEEMRQFWGME